MCHIDIEMNWQKKMCSHVSFRLNKVNKKELNVKVANILSKKFG